MGVLCISVSIQPWKKPVFCFNVLLHSLHLALFSVGIKRTVLYQLHFIWNLQPYQSKLLNHTRPVSIITGVYQLKYLGIACILLNVVFQSPKNGNVFEGHLNSCQLSKCLMWRVLFTFWKVVHWMAHYCTISKAINLYIFAMEIFAKGI